MRIRDVVAAKPVGTIFTAPSTATLTDLVSLLVEHNIGALIISDDGNSVDGIVSERDVVRWLHSHPEDFSTTASAVMTAEVHTCAPDQRLDELMTLMTERRIRHVPVVDGDDLIGIISIGDVVKHKISTLQFERDQLDSYVSQR